MNPKYMNVLINLAYGNTAYVHKRFISAFSVGTKAGNPFDKLIIFHLCVFAG